MRAQVTHIVDRDVRCWRCRRLLAEMVARPWVIVCGRCHARCIGDLREAEIDVAGLRSALGDLTERAEVMAD